MVAERVRSGPGRGGGGSGTHGISSLRSQTRRRVEEELAPASKEKLEEILTRKDLAEATTRRGGTEATTTPSASPVPGERICLNLRTDLQVEEMERVAVLIFGNAGQVEVRFLGFSADDDDSSSSEVAESLLDAWTPGRRSLTSPGLEAVYIGLAERCETYLTARRYLKDGGISAEERMKMAEAAAAEEEQARNYSKEVTDAGKRLKRRRRSVRDDREEERGGDGGYGAEEEEEDKQGRICETCGLECPTPRALYRHKFNRHTERECRFCGARSVGTLALVSHMRRLHPAQYTGHAKTPAVCDYCGKRLGSVDSMRRHVLMLHTAEGEKPYRCDRCPRGFPNPSARRAHMIMAHLKTRPFACRAEGCGVAYNDNASLHTHERKAHGMHQNSKRPRKNP